MRDLPDTEKNYFLEKCSIKENLSTTSGQNVFCLKPSTTENIFMLEEQNAKYIFGLTLFFLPERKWTYMLIGWEFSYQKMNLSNI